MTFSINGSEKINVRYPCRTRWYSWLGLWHITAEIGLTCSLQPCHEILYLYMSGPPNLFSWEYGQIPVACAMYNEINEEKHKLVHTLNRSPDRESNPRPYFCRRGFGLLVSVVVPLMLAVLPCARGCGFDSRSGQVNYIHVGKWCD
jgi:hypothetical protein